MNIKYFIIPIFFLLFFTACSSKINENSFSSQKINLPFPSASLEKTLMERYSINQNLNKKLNAFYKEWKGVKYKFGGNSKRGIDCSAFIQKAYKHKLNISLPRTTYLQAKLGKNISKEKLQLGDLVFFKTGRNTRHVGIYMKDGKFMHASTKKGVIISKLNNVYFKKHYWKAQRLLN